MEKKLDRKRMKNKGDASAVGTPTLGVRAVSTRDYSFRNHWRGTGEFSCVLMTNTLQIG